MVSSLIQRLSVKKKAWILVPVVSFSGILIGLLFSNDQVFRYSGIAGCIISSFILGAIGMLNKKKDVVALLSPLYAIIIFNPWSEFTTGFVMQVLYSLTILVVTIRFVMRFQDAQ